MIKAGVFDNFKGATTLLMWGDREGITTLSDYLYSLCNGDREDFAIEGPHGRVIVSLATAEESSLEKNGEGFIWACSSDSVRAAITLVEPLLDQAGHHFLDVDGLAEQVIIARDEYPDDLR